LPIDELARRSDVIAEVRVASQRDVTSPSGARVRLTELIVDDAWKGARRTERLTLFQPIVGGALVDGAHAFKIGDVRVVFLARKTGAPELVLQMAPGLGVFTIDPAAAATGGALLREDVGDVVDIVTGAHPRPRTFATRQTFVSALRMQPQQQVRP